MKQFFNSFFSLLAILICLNGTSLQGQTYSQKKDIDGNTTLYLKTSNGKAAQAEIFNCQRNQTMSIEGYKECTENPNKSNELKGESQTYTVKLHCDFLPKGNSLTSNDKVFYFDRWNLDSLFFSQTVVTEGIYDIILQPTSPELSYIIIQNFVINRNIDTILYRNDCIKDTLYFEGRDENNQPLLTPDHSDFIGILEFPENLKQDWDALSYNDYDYNYVTVSDFGAQYSLKCGQVIVNDGKFYLISYPKLNGVSSDTILINDPAAYQRANYVFNPSPAAETMFINQMTGWLFDEDDGSPASVAMRDDTEESGFPYHIADTIPMFLNNKISEEDRCSMGGGLTFWEDIDDYDHFMMVEPQHNYVYSENSSVLGNFYPPFPADYISSSNDVRKVGFNSPFISVYGLNNLFGNYLILPEIIFKGQYGEVRKTDVYRSMYTLSKNGQVISSDTVFKYELYFPSEGGLYSLNIENPNYVLAGNNGIASIQMDFNLDLPDANSPQFTSFKILSEDRKISEVLTAGKTATLEFTASDFPLPSGGGGYYQMSSNPIINNNIDSPGRSGEGISSVHSYYKRSDCPEWTELPLIEQVPLFDPIIYGNYYVSDLTTAFSQFTTPGYFDIKIIVIDSAGNSATQTWHPAGYVDVNKPWNYTVTGLVHTISVPNTANPNIYGQPLEPGDWAGAFYMDDNGDEACGGAAMIDAQGNAVVMA
ncbi:MAG: hypothetical protein M0P58_11530, partial [Bacteroidales bacterium]|nr:hypothetical protein [Bacteroidales bacterium]